MVQKLDAKATLLVFPEGEEFEKVCSTLQSIEMLLGQGVKVGYNIATPEQVLMGGERGSHIEGRWKHADA